MVEVCKRVCSMARNLEHSNVHLTIGSFPINLYIISLVYIYMYNLIIYLNTQTHTHTRAHAQQKLKYNACI